MKIDPHPAEVAKTADTPKMVSTAGCSCSGCKAERECACEQGKECVGCRDCKPDEFCPCGDKITGGGIDHGRKEREAKIAASLVRKWHVQQAELAKDIAAFADSLPLYKEGMPSKEGMPAGGAKPIGEPKSRTTIYGIPKNGTIVAELVAEYLRGKGHDVVTTFNADHANFIVDDLLDSGRTAAKYQKRWQVPVYCLYSKKPPQQGDAGGTKYVENTWIVFPWEADPLSEQSETDAVARLIEMAGEDINRDGLRETPERFIKAFKELTRGYAMQVNLKTFEKDGFDQMVALKDIPFHSTCEHHLLPFYGTVHIAYVPSDKILGISKLARLVDKYACRLQNQERIAEQLVKELTEAIKPAGVAVIIEGIHMCCASRGVSKTGMKMVTSKVTGVFRNDNNGARLEFLHLIGK